MTYDQYWYGDPQMVRAFYEMKKQKQEEDNYLAWLHGIYTYQAVSVSLHNIFCDPKKGEKPENYPAKPLSFENEEEKMDEEEEKNYAMAYMSNMVMMGKDWGKKK